MNAKNFSLGLMAIAFGVFGGVVAANVVIDPQAVLGTRLIGPVVDSNERYLRFSDYLAAPKGYDGIMFGSSRSSVLDPKVLSQEMGVSAFSRYWVGYGQVYDHLAVLEYAIRERNNLPQKLRAVFLLLDLDRLGLARVGNQRMSTSWHPVLTGESMTRFVWRHLVAVQRQAWSLNIRHAWKRWRSAMQVGSPAVAAPDPASAKEPSRIQVSAPSRKTVIADREDLAREMEALQRFIALCRANDIVLIVALPPLHPANAVHYDARELDGLAERIAEIVPVWDFHAPFELLTSSEYWIDTTHFIPLVGRMMLDRIFDRPNARHDFGRRIGVR
jgi:hypothetical protein